MTLLLSHIPKTAGTSLRRLVARHTPEAMFVYGPQLSLGTPDIAFAARFRLRAPPPIVMGHFSFGVHRLLGLPPLYATVLREPVARVISLHTFWKSLSVADRPAFFSDDLTLEILATEPVTEHANNHMCRIIAGIPPESGLSIDDDWLLELALHNLERHYALVALIEEIGPFVDHLARRHGWGEYALPFENRSRSELVDVAPRVLAAIAERNRLDIKLVEHVRRRGGLIVREEPL
jgi:hypothetical protein